jgi:hypothetical protein
MNLEALQQVIAVRQSPAWSTVNSWTLSTVRRRRQTELDKDGKTMSRSVAVAVSASSALAVAAGLGIIVMNSGADASTGTAAYSCSAPGYGTQAFKLSGTLSYSSTLFKANSPISLAIHVTGVDPAFPVAINSWSVTGTIGVTGPSSDMVKVVGSGGPVPANQSFSGNAVASWTPRVAGTYKLASMGISFTANVSGSGTTSGTCTVQSGAEAQVAVAAS